MLKNSSDIRPSKSEFQNHCGNETEDSSSSSCQNSYVNIVFKNCSNKTNFPPGLPRQRLNGLTFGINESSRCETTSNKNNESSLAPLDSYIVCGYARRKKGHCCSKNIETQCSRQKISDPIDACAKVCIAEADKGHSQSESAKLSEKGSKVNIRDSCNKISESKLDKSCRSRCPFCTDDTDGYVSKMTTEEDLCRHGSKSDNGCSSGSHTESSYGTKMKGLCQIASISKIPCECCLNPSKKDSHEILRPTTETEGCFKLVVPMKQEPSCSHWGHSISSKIPTRPLYSSTAFNAPRKHHLRKRHLKHSYFTRLSRRESRKSLATSCNRRKELEVNANKNCSKEHRKCKPRNYDQITAKAILFFEDDLQEKSPGEVNVQSKWNALPAHRKFYYFWLALGNEPLSENPYENYIKFTKQRSIGGISLEELEGWSCLPYSKRMFFLTESLLAKFFSTKMAPCEKLYKEYFSTTNKKYSHTRKRNTALLKSNLTMDSENSSVGQGEKISKCDTSSCSF